MPLYEYICSNCGSEFEKIMRFSDVDINSPECPKCQSRHTHKRLSMVASFSSSGSNASSFSSSASCGSSGGFR